MKKTKDIKYLLFLGVLLLAFLYFSNSSSPSTPTSIPTETIKLESCIDGDTANFLVDGEYVKVRFLAIDAPETAKGDTPADPFGDEAATYTCNALTQANVIYFEYEQDKYDRYDRLLAWIFVDDQLLQEQLIQEGLAEVKYIYDDYKYTNVLEVNQKVAQKNKVGLWSTR